MATPFSFETAVRYLADYLPVYAIIFAMNKKAKKRLKEAIQKGYVVQEPGQKFIGGVINAESNCGYAPSFTNRVTETGQKVMPGGRIIITFTKKMPAFATTASIEPNLLIASSATFCAVAN